MDNCIFCEIVKGKINVYKIYEDERVLCILDANPIGRGHCLIIPKPHFKDIYDIDETFLKQIAITAKKIAIILKNKLGTKGVNIFHASGKVAQQSEFHFHVHLIPRYHSDNLNTWPKSKYKEKSLKHVFKQIKG